MQVIQLDANGLQGVLAIRHDPKTDSIKAQLTVPREGAPPWKSVLTVNLGAIRSQVQSVLSNRAGWSVRGAFRAARRATNRVAIKSLLRDVDSIMKNPKFRASLAIASTIYPPLGVSYASIQAGSRLLDAAKKGNPAAISVVADIKVNAKAGDPEAQKMLKALRGIAMSKTQGKDIAAQVGGFWYNRLYRTPAQANSKNPIRAAYSRGMELERSLPKVNLLQLIGR